MSRDPSRPRPRLGFTVPLESLESRTLLSAAAEVGAAETGGPTVTVNLLGGDYLSRGSPYLYGEIGSVNVRVEVYATPRDGKPILIGQDVPWSSMTWQVVPTDTLPDGLYTIEARAVDLSTGVAGPLTPLPSKLAVDKVGPKVVGVRLFPRQGKLEVTYRDYGGDRNAGTGLGMASATYASNYAFSTLDDPGLVRTPDPRWKVTRVESTPPRLRGSLRLVLTIGDGAPIPDGSYRLYIQSPGPSFPVGYPYLVNTTPYYAWGVTDAVGNWLDGEATRTIPAPSPRDYATAFVVRRGLAFRPRAAPSMDVR